MKLSFQNKIISYHILFWLAYVITEYLANLPHIQGREHLITIRSILLTLPIVMIPSYFMVYIAIPKFLNTKKRTLFGLVLALILFGIVFGRVKWLELINYLDSGRKYTIPYTKVLKNVIRDYAIVALAICAHILGDWRRKARENEELMKAKATSDLELLKRQLQPHFLFNTLNNIYSLALKKSKNTEDSILKLSKLLEYLVYQSGEKEVSLHEEVELIKNYVDLERLRYRKKLDVKIDTSDVPNNLQTAPLILLPFIENCFKHGGEGAEEIFWIHMNISYQSPHLQVTIENSKGKNKVRKKKEASGVGLKNIKNRLELLYCNRYQLILKDNEDRFKVDLNIRINDGKI